MEELDKYLPAIYSAIAAIVAVVGAVTAIYKAPDWHERYRLVRMYWPMVVRAYPTVKKYVDLALSYVRKKRGS